MPGRRRVVHCAKKACEPSWSIPIPATIMTDEDVADVVYVEPLTPQVLRRIIMRERPDGLLPTLGARPLSIWPCNWRNSASSTSTACACSARRCARSSLLKIANSSRIC